MTLAEFRKKFREVRKLGWVASHRRGPTGIGQTLERLLELEENNLALPDMQCAELKAHRVGSQSLITLFTFNRKAWKMPPWDAIRKHGTPDKDGRLGLYFTMSKTPNSTGLFLHLTDEAISVRHISGVTIAEWMLDTLAQRFAEKMPALILVSAFSELRGDIEWFKFDRARLLTGTSVAQIRSEIEAGNVLVDLRLHDKGKSARNHGTGFRVREDKLPSLFTKIEEL